MEQRVLILGVVVIIIVVLAFLFGTPKGGEKPSTTSEGVSSITSLADQARNKCIELCQSKIQQGINLAPGPCLSNQIVSDWVCDVAHEPRQDVDNDAANQCPQYGRTASHFVEVDPECNFIRSV